MGGRVCLYLVLVFFIAWYGRRFIKYCRLGLTLRSTLMEEERKLKVYMSKHVYCLRYKTFLLDSIPTTLLIVHRLGLFSSFIQTENFSKQLTVSLEKDLMKN